MLRLDSRRPDHVPGTMHSATAGYEILEHTGELRLRLRAADLGGLLAEGGRALGDILLEHSGAGTWAPARPVHVRARDREALLVDWLNELVFLAETQRWVPQEFEMLATSDTSAQAWVRGVHVPEAPAFVKAATHHGLRVSPANHGLEAEVVLDV